MRLSETDVVPHGIATRAAGLRWRGICECAVRPAASEHRFRG